MLHLRLRALLIQINGTVVYVIGGITPSLLARNYDVATITTAIATTDANSSRVGGSSASFTSKEAAYHHETGADLGQGECGSQIQVQEWEKLDLGF